MKHVLAAGLAISALAALPSALAAQACATPEFPSFEFQVDYQAVFVGDTTRVPRPARARSAPERDGSRRMLVQFVVDTLGVPEPGSFKVLMAPTRGAVDSVRTALAVWRYSPARIRGCKVPQLVQTEIER